MSDPQATALPSISVVIPTYNNLSLLLEALQSVRQLDYPRDLVEVIVVDNASSDRTADTTAERFSTVKLVRLDTNTGFAPACNRGAEEATAEYIAFLNDDAVADKNWLRAMVDTLQEAGGGAVCAASRIMSRAGTDVEFDGASSNLFGAGRPTSPSGWPDRPGPPTTGTPLLFASGGAMLIDRKVFRDVGGFDPAHFAYFEDVDLGWRLWVLGYRVVYAPDAVVRHLGGATGKRSGLHRRYTLWECNALATIIKNYEAGNMERILTGALLLEYKRALMASGDAVDPEHYRLTAPKDTNQTGIERLPKVAVAHLAAIDRLNGLMPHFMAERRRIQARRVRSDAEILPLLGRAYEPQFAGTPYADAARNLYAALDLYTITTPHAPNRVLIIAGAGDESQAAEVATRLNDVAMLSIATISPARPTTAAPPSGNITYHNFRAAGPELEALIHQADALLVFSSTAELSQVRASGIPTASLGAVDLPGNLAMSGPDDPRLLEFARAPRKTTAPNH